MDANIRKINAYVPPYSQFKFMTVKSCQMTADPVRKKLYIKCHLYFPARKGMHALCLMCVNAPRFVYIQSTFK